MLGILYLIVSFFVGYVICSFILTDLCDDVRQTYRGRNMGLSRYFVLLPAWFAAGTLVLTWSVYFVAYFLRNSDNGLLYSDIIVLSAFAILSAIGTFVLFRRKSARPLKGELRRTTKAERVMLVCFLIFSVLLMWRTLFTSHGQLYVGMSVFSDFAPHIGMSSSFAHGNNFPTSFSHFAGAGIRLPFMFEFLAGNLYLLGLPLDYAYNLPSVISLIGCLMLLYALAARISGRRLAGLFSCLFFLFRSSGSLFRFLSEIPAGESVIERLFSNASFIGYTTYEDRGLWNLNVYCNQRQFVFGIMVLLLVISVFLPHVYEFSLRLRTSLKTMEKDAGEETDADAGKLNRLLKKTMLRLRLGFGTREGWLIQDAKLAIFAGIILGGVFYWNKAVVIATLLVLFVLLLVSDRRLELLLVIFMAGGLALLQNQFFTGNIIGIIKPNYGFLANNGTIFGTMDYLLELLGVFPILLLLSFMTAVVMRKYLIAAFSVPLVLAFFVMFSEDVSGGHNLVMLSIMLLNIFIASLLTKLYDNKSIWTRLVCVLAVICMTATGVYDLTTVWRMNTPSSCITLNPEDELTMWIADNCTAEDVFLTDEYAINQTVLGGAQMFLGWPYYAWTVGYPVYERRDIAAQIYETGNQSLLKKLVSENGIRYIMVAHENRMSEEYILNEDNIAATYSCVFESGKGEWRTRIYDAKSLLALW